MKTQVLWLVQIRPGGIGEWRTHGQYATRSTARHVCSVYRTGLSRGKRTMIPALGFGNTRVLKGARLPSPRQEVTS